MRRRCVLSILLLSVLGLAKAQNTNDSVLYNATLAVCVKYALAHQPSLQQAITQESIVDRQIKSRTAAWWPQVSAAAGYQYNFELPTAVFDGNTIRTGQINSSTVQFAASQTLFNRDTYLASRVGKDLRSQAKQQVTASQIDVVVNVGKAFYGVLLMLGQLRLAEDDIDRLESSKQNAYQRYKDGLVDPTDYKQATILLNNAKAQKKQYEELLKLQHATLKEQMGYPPNAPITLAYDSLTIVNELMLDTAQVADYTRRIEYQQLQTEKQLQQANLNYSRWSFIPSLSLVGAYNLSYHNDDFSELYKQSFPSSYAGITLAVPIFQGAKRGQDIKAAKLQLKQLDYGMESLQSSVNVEYEQAMAAYKSYLSAFQLLQENVRLAKEVYTIVDLQYRAGVKTYLDVTTAETDLRTTRQSYLLALFQALSSKLDVQRALGVVEY